LGAVLCNFFCINRNLFSPKDNSKKLVEPVAVIVCEISLQNACVEHAGLLIAGWIDETGLTTVANPVKEFLIC
jgi:hypothetical protein